MCTLFSRKSRDEILFVIPTDDFATVAEPGAARVLPAPHRDGGSAAPTGHTALQSSRDSWSSSTGAVIQTHADDSANGENAGQLQTKRMQHCLKHTVSFRMSLGQWNVCLAAFFKNYGEDL